MGWILLFIVLFLLIIIVIGLSAAHKEKIKSDKAIEKLNQKAPDLLNKYNCPTLIKYRYLSGLPTFPSVTFCVFGNVFQFTSLFCRNMVK